MKILQLGKFYPIEGGVEKVMLDLTTGLSARGIDCDMLCASMKPQQIQLNKHGRLFGVKALKKIAATMISPSMVWTLRKIAKEYDLIHVHHPDPMACLALFCSGFKGKVVLHWHSDILKQKSLLKLYRPFEKWLIRRADMIVGTTPVYVQQSPMLKKVQHKVDYIPIGVEELQPTPEGVERIRSQYPGKKIVYSLGRLVEYKGFVHLVDAASHLDEEYVVLIGGNGPLRETIEQRIEELELQDKVKLLGYVKEEESADYFGACDVFCLSSIWKTEAFAIVQVEAMSCGKPIVATRIPESGVSWVNRHEYSGVNVPIKSGIFLAEAIHYLTKSEWIYDGYAERARRLYEECFTLDKMIDRCVILYDKILSE